MPSSLESRRPKEIVLLIHGTGAADTSDTGKKWWQIDSPFYHELNQQICPRGSCHTESRHVFHWSGENSEAARTRAGQSLYEHMRRIENEGYDYHIVAHSHGGSILWIALRQSVRKGKLFAGLRSWTTLGTPFLDFRPKVAELATYPTLFLLAAFIILRQSDQIYLHRQLLEAPIDLVEWKLRWGLPCIWLAIGCIAAYAGFRALKVLVELGRWLRQRSLNERCFRQYHQTWLPLWSVYDEAINGLRNTFVLSGAISPRFPPPARPLLRTLAFPVKVLLNCIVAPLVDAFIWSRIRNRLQGNDVIARELATVSPGPLTESPPDPLHPEVSRRLLQAAGERTTLSLMGLREGFADWSESCENIGKLASVLSGHFTGNELVHCSYFSDVNIVERISQHVLTKGSYAVTGDVGTHGGSVQESASPPKEFKFSSYSPNRKQLRKESRILASSSFALVSGMLIALSIIAGLIRGGIRTDAELVSDLIDRIPLDQAIESGGQTNVYHWLSTLINSGYPQLATRSCLRLGGEKEGRQMDLLAWVGESLVQDARVAASMESVDIYPACVGLLYTKKMDSAFRLSLMMSRSEFAPRILRELAIADIATRSEQVFASRMDRLVKVDPGGSACSSYAEPWLLHYAANRNYVELQNACDTLGASVTPSFYDCLLPVLLHLAARSQTNLVQRITSQFEKRLDETHLATLFRELMIVHTRQTNLQQTLYYADRWSRSMPTNAPMRWGEIMSTNAPEDMFGKVALTWKTLDSREAASRIIAQSSPQWRRTMGWLAFVRVTLATEGLEEAARSIPGKMRGADFDLGHAYLASAYVDRKRWQESAAHVLAITNYALRKEVGSGALREWDPPWDAKYRRDRQRDTIDDAEIMRNLKRELMKSPISAITSDRWSGDWRFKSWEIDPISVTIRNRGQTIRSGKRTATNLVDSLLPPMIGYQEIEPVKRTLVLNRAGEHLDGHRLSQEADSVVITRLGMNRLFDRAKMSDRPADRSNAYKKIAEEFARYGQYRAAIAAGERCEFPNDRVAAFTAILERYFIRNGSLMISNTVSPMHQ